MAYEDYLSGKFANARWSVALNAIKMPTGDGSGYQGFVDCPDLNPDDIYYVEGDSVHALCIYTYSSGSRDYYIARAVTATMEGFNWDYMYMPETVVSDIALGAGKWSVMSRPGQEPLHATCESFASSSGKAVLEYSVPDGGFPSSAGGIGVVVAGNPAGTVGRKRVPASVSEVAPGRIRVEFSLGSALDGGLAFFVIGLETDE